MNLFALASHYYDGIRIVKDWVGEGGHVVSGDKSQERANSCLPCEFNVKAISLEKETAEAIKKIVELKNHLKLRVNGEKKLGSCAKCSCHLPTKVHTPLEYIMRYTEIEELKKYPEHCWLRKENNL